MKLNLTTVSAIVVCGAASFFLGRLTTASGDRDGGLSASADEGRAIERSGSTGPPTPESRGASGMTRRSNAARAKTASQVDEFADVLRLINPVERNRAFLKWLDDLDPSQIPGAIEQLRATGLMDSRRGEHAMLLSLWASHDPEAAMADALTHGNSGRSVETILETWTRNDPEAAIAWVQSANQDDSRNPYFSTLLGKLVSNDPVRANSLLAALPPGRSQDRAISAILRNSLVQGPEAARSWIGSIQDPALHGNAVVQVAGDMARIDPEGTATWLKGLEGPSAEQATFHLMAEWQQKDAAAAAGYFETMPEGPARGKALGGLVASLSRDDPQSAAALLDRYPGDVSDSVIQEFVYGAARSDPAFAVNHVERLHPGMQNAALDRVLSRWMRRDRAAAMAWVEANPVSPEIQRNLGIGR